MLHQCVISGSQDVTNANFSFLLLLLLSRVPVLFVVCRLLVVAHMNPFWVAKSLQTLTPSPSTPHFWHIYTLMWCLHDLCR